MSRVRPPVKTRWMIRPQGRTSPVGMYMTRYHPRVIKRRKDSQYPNYSVRKLYPPALLLITLRFLDGIEPPLKGPRSVTNYTYPFSASLSDSWRWFVGPMTVGVTIHGRFHRLPIIASSLPMSSAIPFPIIHLCPFTHTSSFFSFS